MIVMAGGAGGPMLIRLCHHACTTWWLAVTATQGWLQLELTQQAAGWQYHMLPRSQLPAAANSKYMWDCARWVYRYVRARAHGWQPRVECRPLYWVPGQGCEPGPACWQFRSEWFWQGQCISCVSRVAWLWVPPHRLSRT